MMNASQAEINCGGTAVYGGPFQSSLAQLASNRTAFTQVVNISKSELSHADRVGSVTSAHVNGTR